MSTSHQRTISHKFAALVAAFAATVALACAGLFIAPSSAHAHDTLIGTDPGDQKVLDAAPSEIQLQFNNSVLDVGAVIEVRDASDGLVSEGEPVLDGPVVSQPVQADLPDGAYRVIWRVVSSDGHPINGTFAFAIGADGEAALSELPEASSEDEAVHDHGEDEAEGSHDHGDEASDGQDAAATDSEQSNDTQKIVWGSVIALVGVAIVVAVMVWFTRSSKKSTKSDPDSE